MNKPENTLQYSTLYREIKHGSILQISCNGELEAMLINFATLYAPKFTGLWCPLNDCSNHTLFCNMISWSFLNYWFIELCRFSKYWHIHYKIWKYQPDFIRKDLSFGKLSNSWWQIWVLQNSIFSFGSLNLIISNKHSQLWP